MLRKQQLPSKECLLQLEPIYFLEMPNLSPPNNFSSLVIIRTEVLRFLVIKLFLPFRIIWAYS